MASQRVVTIKLVAEATGVVQGINRAKDAVGELKTKTADSARSQREEWNKVGTGLLAVGVATTGLGVAALRTGIQYNTLQQTTRAALSTLLGSAQAANAQMDKLDNFARNSPFSKATFIQAQQQMLGFGVAAKDVVPALDSIQNAVAAMGGSNDQIAAISEIMARIKSESRLSGDALQRLGYYGIDAAEIIGSQMGKTAAEIRDMAGKPGGIPAEQIWDPLVNGLQEKFGGAADNVKQTFEGSLDRVSAAWRDFASELATPLVDPTGGGALVDLLNWTADAMRNFEGLPDPVKRTSSALVGLAGAGSLALGAGMLVLPKWLEMTDALKTLGITGSRATSVMGRLVRVAGTIAAVSVATAAVDGLAKELASKLSPSADETTNAILTSKSAVEAFAGSLEARLPGTAGNAADQVQKLGAALDAAAESSFWDPIDPGFDTVLGTWRVVGEEIAAIAKTDMSAARDQFLKIGEGANLSRQQMGELIEQSPALRDALTSQATAAELGSDSATLLKIAMGEIGPAADGAGSSAQSSAEKFMEQANAAKAASDQLLALIETLNEANDVGQSVEATNSKYQDTLASVAEYIANAQEGLDGYSLSLDANTVEGAKNRDMLAGFAADSQAAAAATFEQETATLGSEQAMQNYIARLSQGRDGLIATAQQFGLTRPEAEAFADAIYQIPTQRQTELILEAAQAKSAIDTYLSRLNSIPAVVSTEIRTFEATIYTQEGIDKKYGRARGGLIGYAGGGIIPGYDPVKRDTVLTPMRRGEGVLVPEVVRGLGASTIHRLNAAGNSGGVSAVQSQFASMRASDFVSAFPQQIVVERTVVEHVPTEVTVKDANNRLIGTMGVVADQKIDAANEQQAQANRKAGH